MDKEGERDGEREREGRGQMANRLRKFDSITHT